MRVRVDKGGDPEGRTYRNGCRPGFSPGTQRAQELREIGMKRCTGCGEVKPFSEFSSNRAQRHGLHNECKPCSSARAGAWHRDNRARLQARRYGLTEAELAELMEVNGGICPVCEERPATVVDHDHDTGDVRGALCSPCNRGIGCLGDDAAGLRRALVYLETTHLHGVS